MLLSQKFFSFFCHVVVAGFGGSSGLVSRTNLHWTLIKDPQGLADFTSTCPSSGAARTNYGIKYLSCSSSGAVLIQSQQLRAQKELLDGQLLGDKKRERGKHRILFIPQRQKRVLHLASPPANQGKGGGKRDGWRIFGGTWEVRKEEGKKESFGGSMSAKNLGESK